MCNKSESVIQTSGLNTLVQVADIDFQVLTEALNAASLTMGDGSQLGPASG